MKKIKAGLLMLLVFAVIVTASGCWNYREVDMLSIVAGVAIDKGETYRYAVTAEVIVISGGKEARMTPKIVTAEGRTLFDAVRNLIAVSGKRLYWSHAEALILSKDIAGEGVSRILDFFIRDAETREDMPLLISREDTAKAIFGGEAAETVVSMSLGETLENLKSLGKAQITDILQYKIESKVKGASVIVPAIGLKQENDKKKPEILGTAIIKKDRFAGFLSGEEAKCVYFVRDELKYGIMAEEYGADDEKTLVSLEIFRSKTKVAPVVKDKDIGFDIDIKTKVAIDEISGKGDFSDEEALNKLRQSAEESLEAQIVSVVKKLQTEYSADVFGFASTLWQNQPQAYKAVAENWDEVFKGVQVHVQSKIIFQNSATLEEKVK